MNKKWSIYMNDRYIGRVSLKYQILSETAKEGSVFVHQTQSYFSWQIGVQWDCKVIKTISCNKSKTFSKISQKSTNLDFIDALEIKRNGEFY